MTGDEPARGDDERATAERLEEIERALREQGTRLRAIEERLNGAPARASYERGGDATRATEARSAQTGATKRRDVEALVAGSWFNWLGVIAIAFGVAFLLKYAFDKDWVTPGILIAMGGAAGIAVLALAELLRERGLRSYAYVLSGGGVLILYLSAYAAYGFYGKRFAAFLLMSLVTACAVALAVRQDASPVASIGLIGGFLTPPLLSSGRGDEVALFTYVALLDAGVVALAYFKRWRWLNTMSLFGTILTTLAWTAAYYRREKLSTTLFFLTLFFLIYAAIGVVRHIVRRSPARWTDALLVVVNATFYLSMGLALLEGAGRRGLRGPFALGVAALFGAFFFAANARRAEVAPFAFAYAAAAVGALAVAAAIEFEREWVTVSWAILGSALLVWGYLRGRRDVRVLGLSLLGITTFKVFLYDLASLELIYRIVSFILLGAILLAVSYSYQRSQRGADAEDS